MSTNYITFCLVVLKKALFETDKNCEIVDINSKVYKVLM